MQPRLHWRINTTLIQQVPLLRSFLFGAVLVLQTSWATSAASQEAAEASETQAERPNGNELIVANFSGFLEQSRRQLRIGVEDRLLVLLDALPKRWAALPAPKVAYSGLGSNQVLAAANPADLQSAVEKFGLYFQLPLDSRAMALSLLSAPSTEVEVWAPLALVVEMRTQIAAEDWAVLVEAFLGLAEAYGRQDALLEGASIAVNFLLRSRGIGMLHKTTAAWAALPITKEAQASAAQFHLIQAQVFEIIGNSREALNAYRKARSVFEKEDNPLGQGNSWNGEGDVLQDLGRSQEALDAYKRARALFELIGEMNSRGYSFRGEATVLIEIGRSKEALDAIRKARLLFESTGDKLGQGTAWSSEADALLRLGRHLEALNAYQKARSIFEIAGSYAGQGNSFQDEADILLALGSFQESLKAFRKARSIFEINGDNFSQGRSWSGEASALYGLNSYSEAIGAARRAIATFDSFRGGFPDETSRLKFQDSIASTFDVLVSALTKLGNSANVVVAAEEAKSRVFLDLIANPLPRRVEMQEAFDLSEKKRELQASLAQLETSSRESTVGRNERQQLQAEFDRQLEQLSFEGLLASEVAFTEASTLTFDQISETVEQNGPVLGFYVAEEQTFSYLLVPHKEPQLFRLPLTKVNLRHRASKLNDQLANQNHSAEEGKNSRSLWQDLLFPLEKELPAGGSLVLVPHGPLHQIPFEALVSPNGKRLFENFQLTVVPSLAALVQLRERRQPQTHQGFMAAFVSGSELSLPLSEAQAISELFQQSSVAELTFEAYQRLASKARQILIAGHGTHRAGDLRQTYIELEATKEHDHRLSAAEIATIPLKAELVVLAACDTSVGEALLSDERLDLSRAFLIAGAGAVLATRWEVPDDPRTTQFLLDFYRAYGGTDGKEVKYKNVALNEARRLSFERGDSSAIWAAWVLIGDPR